MAESNHSHHHATLSPPFAGLPISTRIGPSTSKRRKRRDSHTSFNSNKSQSWRVPTLLSTSPQTATSVVFASGSSSSATSSGAAALLESTLGYGPTLETIKKPRQPSGIVEEGSVPTTEDDQTMGVKSNPEIPAPATGKISTAPDLKSQKNTKGDNNIVDISIVVQSADKDAQPSRPVADLQRQETVRPDSSVKTRPWLSTVNKGNSRAPKRGEEVSKDAPPRSSSAARPKVRQEDSRKNKYPISNDTAQPPQSDPLPILSSATRSAPIPISVSNQADDASFVGSWFGSLRPRRSRVPPPITTEQPKDDSSGDENDTPSWPSTLVSQKSFPPETPSRTAWFSRAAKRNSVDDKVPSLPASVAGYGMAAHTLTPVNTLNPNSARYTLGFNRTDGEGGSWWPSIGWGAEQPIGEEEPVSSAPIEETQEITDADAADAPDLDTSSKVPTPSAWYTTWSGTWRATSSVRPKTAAELVKEEALARDGYTPSGPIDFPTPTPREVNPLSSDAVENRASWASFFSLQAAYGARRITLEGEADEDIGDVMDLEGDMEAPRGREENFRKGLGEVAKRNIQPESRRPKKSRTGPAPPLTDSNSIKGKVRNANPDKRSPSTTPSKSSGRPSAPNMVLPTFSDTFYTLPRILPPFKHQPSTAIAKIGKLVGGALFGAGTPGGIVPGEEMQDYINQKGNLPTSHKAAALKAARDVGRDLPRVSEVLGIQDVGRIKESKRVVVIGIHGWFPGAIMRILLGEPTGTSPKFAAMMETAVLEFMEGKGVKLEKLTTMPLEGEGTIEQRVDRLYSDFLSKPEWVKDLHEADTIFIATHSQGSIVSTQLLDKMITDGHIRTAKNWEIVQPVANVAVGGLGLGLTTSIIRPPQKVCCLALCGIHLGPLLYLNTSSLVQPYIQYFESVAAKELFEFQDTGSDVSKKYLAALENVLDHGVKFVYVASLDDQVVPIYSGIFSAVNHPRILRALYIDGDAYSSSDFLSNLIVLLLRIRNAGIDDGGLLAHLSEATAGSLSGVGHSSVYLDPGPYQLAARFLFETSDALGDDIHFEYEHFIAKASRNDYEIPWALRGLIADPRCEELFAKEFAELRNAFDDWQPRTTILRDVRRKLEPIRGRRTRFAPENSSNAPAPSLSSTKATR